MRKTQVVAGQVFGDWTILKESPPRDFPSGQKQRVVGCRCVCGVEKFVQLNSIQNGRSVGCGCKRNLDNSCRATTHGCSHRNRSLSGYSTWINMRERCLNPKGKHYHYYGGRGISICEAWQNSFEKFQSDMGPKPKGASLDRIDNSKGYSPENCRWATSIEQNRNTRSNRLIEFRGEVKCFTEWCEVFGINPGTLYNRLNRFGWSVEDALTKPVQRSASRNVHQRHGSAGAEGEV